jgi:hypothetical protein
LPGGSRGLGDVYKRQSGQYVSSTRIRAHYKCGLTHSTQLKKQLLLK